MKWNLKRELSRKIVHLGSILFLVIYIYTASVFSHRIALLALSFLLVVLIELEYFRVEWGMKMPMFYRYIRRKKEKNRLGGEVFFLIGAIICLAVFDLRIAFAAILMTTFGDLAAALVGKRFGKLWIPGLKNKALEGVLAEFVVDLFIGWLIVRTLVNNSIWWLGGTSIVGEPIWFVIFTMALTATVVDAIVDKFDDNLLIPLFSGFNGHLILLLMSMRVL